MFHQQEATALRTATGSTKDIPAQHLNQDEFDDYFGKRLKGARPAHLEEHLLLCERCRSDGESVQEYWRLMLNALESIGSADRASPASTDMHSS